MTENQEWTIEDYANWEHQDFQDYMMESGHILIYAGFLELCSGDREQVRYTLKNRAQHGFPSFYQIVANAKDEYDAAMKTCGDWQIWQRWKRSKAIYNGERPGVYKGLGMKHALESMEAKRSGEAMAAIIDRANDGDYRAAKDLVTWGIPKKKTGKKVTQVTDDEKRDNIFAIAEDIAKKA